MAGNLSSKLEWNLANPKWAATLNPIVANPMVSGMLLENIKVSSGNNTINHKLGKKLTGWIPVRNDSSVTFYDRQATNQKPDLTLILVSSGSATISLYVF